MKILWITSFRNFKKVSRDTDIQLKFLKEIAKISNVDLCITQFNEKNVKSNVKKFYKKFYYKNYDTSKKNFKYSQSIVLENGLEVLKKNPLKYDAFIWSTADIVFSKNFKRIINNIKNNSICTVFPNIHIYKRKRIDHTKINFGLDFFLFKISENKINLLYKYNRECSNYDWGCYEHFLFCMHKALNLHLINLRYHLKLFKYDNEENTFKKTRNSQILSWNKNQKNLIKFLNKRNLSIFYAKGSFFYIALKLFKFSDISPTMLVIYGRLFIKFLILLIKKFTNH